LLEKQGLTPRDGHDEASHQIFEEQKAFISKRITQTQQETLEWCLDEVIEKDMKKKKGCLWNESTAQFTHAYNKRMRQTIKKKIGGEK